MGELEDSAASNERADTRIDETPVHGALVVAACWRAGFKIDYKCVSNEWRMPCHPFFSFPDALAAALLQPFMAAPHKPNTQEHPLANILINVLIPVLALSYLSRDPEFQQAIGKTVKPWHIGPVKALVVGLMFPIAYGVWYFVKTRKPNFFSALGLISVLLTGGLTIFLWNKDGTVKPHADVLFGLKEASIPFVLGLAVIGSHYTASPLLRVFIYSDSLFDIPKIERRVDEIHGRERYQQILFQATLMFAASFFISTVLNFGLALYFLGDLDHAAANARELYNERVAKLTGWGFLVIGLPILVFLFFTLRRLLANLGALTGLKDDELMLPR